MYSVQLWLAEYWPHILFVISGVASTAAAVHAAMTKQDVRAAIGWVAVVIFSPLLGAAFYLVAGINRVRTCAQTVRNRFIIEINNAIRSIAIKCANLMPCKSND